MEHERDRPRAMLGRHEHGLLRPLPKNVSDPSRILMPSPRSQMLLLDQRRPRLLRRGIGPLQAGHPVSAEQAVVRDQSRGENRGGGEDGRGEEHDVTGDVQGARGGVRQGAH